VTFSALSDNQVAAMRGVVANPVCPMAARTRTSLRARGLIVPIYDETVGVNRGAWLGDTLTPAGRIALGLECGHMVEGTP